MASQQDYLDDLERRFLVEVKVNEKGEKTYTPRSAIAVPMFIAMPYSHEIMFPQQWRESVLKNFTEVYLKWWTEAFEALRAQMSDQVVAAAVTETSMYVYNQATELWEERPMPPSGT